MPELVMAMGQVLLRKRRKLKRRQVCCPPAVILLPALPAQGIDANDLRTLSRLVAKERKEMDWEFVDVEDGLRKAGLKSLFPDRVCLQLYLRRRLIHVHMGRLGRL